MIKGRSIWGPLAFVASFFVFARLRGYADQTGISIRFRYPVEVDHWLFNGHDPVVWLQNRLGHTGRIDPLDYALVFIYITYFVVPPATVALLWWFRSRAFVTVALAITGTLYLGLLFNFMFPTAPPWLAAQDGYIAYVPRLVPTVLNSIVPGIFRTGDSVGGPNDVAAMPSLHIAIIAVISFYYMTRGRRGLVFGLLYILAMSFSLLYLGEHYIVDIVAGIAIAAVSWVVVNRALDYWDRRHATNRATLAAVEAGQTDPSSGERPA